MIYLLKFQRPIGGHHPCGKAEFYLGYCDDGRLDDRIAEHRAGRGAAITRWLVRNGVGFDLVAVIPEGDRSLERRLKSYKKHRYVLALIEKGKFGGKIVHANK